MIYFIGPTNLIKSTLYEESTMENCLKWISEVPYINLDTETEGRFNHKNKILMLQLNYHDTSYVIDVRCTNILPLKSMVEP